MSLPSSLRRGAAVLLTSSLAGLGGVVFGAAVAAAAPTPEASPTVSVYASSVNVRTGGSACKSSPSIGNCSTIVTTVGPATVRALCQRAGQTISDGGYSSNYWTWVALSAGSGFISNVYITGAAHLAGVPDCATGDPATASVYASGVNVRGGGGSGCTNAPSTSSCPTVVATVGPATYTALCQQTGQTISAGGYSSSWWTWVVLPSVSGFVTNVYLTGAAHLAGVPDCAPGIKVPGAPTGVKATPGDAKASVTWTAPASDGGAAITGYTVTAAPGGAHTTSKTPSATVTGLTNGTSYTFTVKATNSAGTGAPSTASAAVKPAGPAPTAPGAPTAVKATAGDAKASVTWTAPASNGGAAITGYTVTAAPGGAHASSTTTSATVTGLTNGTSYTFTVKATNSAGTGATSAPSAAVKPTAPTGPPPVTSKPPTTNSHYVRNRTANSDDSATAEAEGTYDAKQSSPDPSFILLSYGHQAPPPDQGASETGGTGNGVTDPRIVSHAEAYIDGWRAGDATAPLELVISPNNDNGWIGTDATAAGTDWATNVVAPVLAYAKAHDAGVTVAGGMDVEDWGGDGNVADTKAWITAFLKATTADFVNHGAASGCPETYTTGSSQSCEGGWSQADYYAVSGGLDPGRISVLPQIYNSDMPQQWEAIDLVGITSNSGPKLTFAGPLTENRANTEDSGSNGDLTPTQAWNQLWGQLTSSSQTTQSTLPYSTDLFDDSVTTTPPPIS